MKVKTLTSAASPEALLPSHARRGPARARTLGLTRSFTRGFTLIELLVVLAIAGIIVAVVPLAYGKAREAAQYRDTLRTIITTARQARQTAISQGNPQSLLVNLQQRTVGLQGRAAHPVPLPLAIRATVGQQLLTDSVAEIVFLPSGGASGGSIEIIRPSAQGTRIRIDWLTGQITQERLLP